MSQSKNATRRVDERGQAAPHKQCLDRTISHRQTTRQELTSRLSHKTGGPKALLVHIVHNVYSVHNVYNVCIITRMQVYTVFLVYNVYNTSCTL